MVAVIEDFVVKLNSGRQGKWSAYLIIGGLEGVIFWLDIVDAHVPLFACYILPIMLSAWMLDRKFTYLLVVLSSLGAAYALKGAIPEDAGFTNFIFNVLQSAVAFVLAEFFVHTLRQSNMKVMADVSRLHSEVNFIQHQHRLETSIRRATVKDIDEIMLLAAEGAHDGGLSEDILGAARQEDLRQHFVKGLVNGFGIRGNWHGSTSEVPIEFWVSVMDRKVVGFFLIMGIENMEDVNRELHIMVVKEEYRGRGIGSAMLDFFCKHFSNRQLFIACKPQTKMDVMARRMGFVKFADSTGGGYVVLVRAA